MLINDLLARTRAHEALINAALQRVVARGWFVLGPEVAQFEQAFSAYLGLSHCVTVANGTDAIEIGLRAIGMKKGSKIATVANAGMYSTTAILAIGAEPCFMDVAPDTHNVALEEVERVIALGIDAVIVTHLYGRAVADIEEVARLCNAAGVRLFEDCAQAHGARINGRKVGSFGAASSFSFYPTKNLGALGDGGAIATASDEVAAVARSLRQYGWAQKYQVSRAHARNSRLDEMQAAVLSEFLPLLDATNARRRHIAQRYSDAIKHPRVSLPSWTGEDYVAHLFVVRCPERDALRAHLRGLDIAAEIHYPLPDHRQPVFGATYSEVSLPDTEQLATDILTLPCYPEMTDEQVDLVIDGINAWVA
ncbi:DegT/DnrJ/EryC1/StrS family aminotransferase [Herbaspirillum frisingense]|uniref:DegT/DnrJ/EryC1/StrS aminotransferase n=1 Tax=Herbaspirillum frisingense GSF30 TaxID=864073 RepID=A0AAI9I9R5_9BURK|nr:DegT/DnrJ/EryC1/StrS family aminotransferase [Herbaspirillum frisingense]EOA02186.1 DegT/DnrJ/EryC1/StrS aminotransferase [Herbaspirillum frisingense GSF30]UIN20722.1 DegT/DnrJ/EryC1/StrS family aminotransferase [Herbaspirillum frisingense]